MSGTPEMNELLAITPPGDALPSDADSTWATWLQPWANELGLVRALGQQMLAEVDPGTAQYLLTDYERVLGPDPYGRDTGPLTIAQRQALAHSRWTGKYGVRPADFIALAASFGTPISIREYTLTRANDFAGELLVDGPTQYTWLVTLPGTADVEYAYASQASAGDLVGSYQPSNVETVLRARAPAHTTVAFQYGVPNEINVTAAANGIVGAPLAVSGSVAPTTDGVEIAFGASDAAPPISGWVAAQSVGGSFTGTVAPDAAGTGYVWAQDAATGLQAVSGAVAVSPNSISVAAGAGAIAQYAALAVTGNISPATDGVQVALGASATVAPASGWSAATVSAGAFSASLTPAAAGTVYVWARDTLTGLTAVSAAVTVAANSFTVSAPASVINGQALSVTGTVAPAGDGMQIAIGVSATSAPTSGWVAAEVDGGSFSGSIPAATIAPYVGYGVIYVWAQNVSTGQVEVSAPVILGVNNLTVNCASSALVNEPLEIFVSVSPATDGVAVAFGSSASIPPTSGWVAATGTGGSLTAQLTPATTGSLYVWAQDQLTGRYAISPYAVSVTAPVGYTIANPGGTYTAGQGTIPISGTISPATKVFTYVTLSTNNTGVSNEGQYYYVATEAATDDGWSINYPTPTTAGEYYVWVETQTGADQIISPFTITVNA